MTGAAPAPRPYEQIPPADLDRWALTRWTAARWMRSLRAVRRERRSLAQVEAYVMFVGYQRSGHSIVGSLLNAHPEAVVAHELDALWFLSRGFSGRQLMAMALDRDREAHALSEFPGRYDYRVPGQWHGRFDRLRVVGDKKGGGSATRLGRRPDLLDRLRARVRVPLRMVHVTRDPFDNIATMHQRKGRAAGLPLAASADRYFHLAEANREIATRARAGEWLSMRHEDFVADPRAELRRLCEFVGLTAEQGYLDDCAAIVRDSTRRSRDDEDWPPELLADVRRRARDFAPLAGYVDGEATAR